MLVWIICGAKSKVGKSYVAKRLCAVLPESVYAKLGHGERRPGKPENFFTRHEDLLSFLGANGAQLKHAVVEANSGNFAGFKTVRIFIGAAEMDADTRNDAESLKEIADIEIDKDSDAADWEAVVSAAVGNSVLASAILSILSAQKRRLALPAVSVHSKVWLVNREMEHVFGPGLAGLLAEVEHLGSLKAAAERCGISYRHAWGAIRRAESCMGLKLISASPGGKGGGRSHITEDARRVMAIYETLTAHVSQFADAEFGRLHARFEGAT